MKNVTLLAMFSFLLSFIVFPASAERFKASDGQTYSTRLKVKMVTMSGDEFDTAIGRILVKSSIAAPISLIVDTHRIGDWVHDIVASEVIERPALTDQTLYLKFNAPLTLENRDAFIRFVGEKVTDNRFQFTLFEQLNHFPKRDAVRMADIRGHIILEQVAPEWVAMEFSMHYSPKVRPVFAANQHTKEIVTNTIKKFRKIVEREMKGTTLSPKLASELSINAT
ncbi:hypothetical protein CS022_22110 [Veronia nyctiphanis]|uniref:Uncharacterized protein n=1 Tax=Veronia nyctiphanis TaxID=1278244 RepID=A0A4V1LS86_9GAMM|nr:hypothetical protein [Veronia nyctiphanis]RXJ70828.1 hypothetical protein CS022_22110 [Veronia nyctiphanis]